MARLLQWLLSLACVACIRVSAESYTTNVIESLHMQLRKIIKTRGHFPSDEAATKLLWLALRNVMSKSVRSTREWKIAMNQFGMLFGDHFKASRA